MEELSEHAIELGLSRGSEFCRQERETATANREKERDGSIAEAFIRAGRPVEAWQRLCEVGNVLKDVPRFWKRLGSSNFEHGND